ACPRGADRPTEACWATGAAASNTTPRTGKHAAARGWRYARGKESGDDHNHPTLRPLPVPSSWPPCSSRWRRQGWCSCHRVATP
ncbi:MAG: hypothetical protein LC775_14240, partial [Acidobacteria bacterium]|nr:hypothetical protein [Acidobacteriota bacterium]